MARVEVMSPVRVGSTVYAQGQIVEMAPSEIESLPTGIVRVIDDDAPQDAASIQRQIVDTQRELGEIDRRSKKYKSDKSYVESQEPRKKELTERLDKLRADQKEMGSAHPVMGAPGTGRPGQLLPSPPTEPGIFGYPADSPVEVFDPATGRPYADNDESPAAQKAREMRLASIIHRQDQPDLRHPATVGIPAGSDHDAKITEEDGLPAEGDAKSTQHAPAGKGTASPPPKRDSKGGPVVDHSQGHPSATAGQPAATTVTAQPGPAGPQVPAKEKDKTK